MDDTEFSFEDDAMRRFPVPDEASLPEDLRERIAAETERAGFTPNVFAALAYAPEQFRAFFAFHDAFVDDPVLDREEVEMIIVAVSGVNHCYYCNVAHGALCRIYAKDPLLADQLVANYRTADVSDARLVMLDVAVIGAVTAFFNLSNRLALLADMRPNEEFHEMGRS